MPLKKLPNIKAHLKAKGMPKPKPKPPKPKPPKTPKPPKNPPDKNPPNNGKTQEKRKGEAYS